MSAFEQMNENLTKDIRKIYDKWLDIMDVDVAAKLNRTLMCRSVTHPGLLECNIDRVVLEMCEEAQSFGLLGFGTPVHINQVYSRYNTIRLVYESVLTVVLDYNKILGALSEKERLLFKALIQAGDRKIMPGLYKLTWGGEMIDAYIAECVKHIGQLQEFVDVYKNANESIVRMCERICDTPIIRIVSATSTSLAELGKLIKKTRHSTMEKLIGHYNDIVNMIKLVYDGFESQMINVYKLIIRNYLNNFFFLFQMQLEWVEYIRKLDNLLQEALRACAKNTVQSLFNRLHGDGTMGPSPLILIDIDLKNGKV